MPSSSWAHISATIDKIYALAPTSVLDIGVGFGKWGFLLREYLDVCQNRYNKTEWRTKIDGIEIFAPYITDVHRFLYDNIIIGDVREVISQVDDYDLIIIGDVIEHLPKPDALLLIDQLVKKGKSILINLPLGVWEQGEVFGNPHEEHVSIWNIGELEHYNVRSHDVFRFIDGRELVLLEIAGLHKL